MTNWHVVLLYELRRELRRKSYLFITFAVPLLVIVAFFGYQLYQESSEGSSDEPAKPFTEVNESNDHIGYVDRTPQQLFPAPDTYERVTCQATNDEAAQLRQDADPSMVRSTLIKRVSSPYCLKNMIVRYDTVDAGKSAVEDGDVDVLYVIEPDYIEDGEITVYFEGLNIEVMSSEETITDYILRSLLYNVDAQPYEQLYLRLRDPAVITEHTVAASGEAETGNENSNLMLVYGFGMIMMMSLFWGGGYLMQSVVQEKESRIVEIILSSVQPTALLVGKILAEGLLALLQVAMLLGTFVFLGSQVSDVIDSLQNIEVGTGTLALCIIYFLLGFLFFGSLMAAIGALSTSVRESQNFVVLVTLPAVVPFFFISIFAEDPNSTLVTVLSMIPVTSPLSMIMRLSVTDVPAGELILSMALLVGGVMAVMWMAGRLFRVNTLLMGNMPKPRDIPRLLFG
ncbi:MAG: ABC transporter permease [Anaerolineae bacterium]|nr:ABC transporter permease [Anaerolineae bacterium]